MTLGRGISAVLMLALCCLRVEAKNVTTDVVCGKELKF